MIHTIIRDLDEEEMKTLIKCLGKLDIFSEKATRSDRRDLVAPFCVYDEPACSILRWAHLFDKIL